MEVKEEIVGESMPVKIEDAVLADIKKTGFRLEIWAAAELKKRGWKVDYQEYYEDSESETRSIDIIATKRMAGSSQIAGKTSIKIILECKQLGKNPSKRKIKSEETNVKNPWVFYVPDGPFPFGDTEKAARIGIAHAHGLEDTDILFSILSGSHLFKHRFRLSVIALEAFSGGFNTVTHEGISQVVMATRYFQSELQELITTSRNSWQGSVLYIFYPVVLLDARLFELNYNPDYVPKVEKSDYITHIYRFEGKIYFIEIVKKDFFRTLIERIEQEAAIFGQEIFDTPIG